MKNSTSTLNSLFLNIFKITFFSFLAFCVINILIQITANPGSATFGSF